MNANPSGKKAEDASIQEVIASFDETVPSSLVFVSGGSFNFGTNESDPSTSTRQQGEIIEYKISQHQRKQNSDSANTISEASETADSLPNDGNMHIDSLMEELKRNQARRDQQKLAKRPTNNSQLENHNLASVAPQKQTSNLRLGNLSSNVTPEMITTEFSCYGPILSTKVMISRGDEKYSSKTCGFVLFAYRSDAERAKLERDGTQFFGSQLVMDWATTPDPQSLARMMKDMQASLHLSSNSAQLVKHQKSPKNRQLSNSLPRGAEIIYIIFPQDKISHSIDDLAKRVFRDPSTESIVLGNLNEFPDFAWMTDHSSSHYHFYQWRLRCLKRGESLTGPWNLEPYRLDSNGAYYIPPPLSDTDDMDTETNANRQSALVAPHLAKEGLPLDNAQLQVLDQLLSKLSPERDSIRTTMNWAIDNHTSAPEIVEKISSLILDERSKLLHKISLLFLVSDILHNAKHMMSMEPTEFSKVWLFSACLYGLLPQFLRTLGKIAKSIPGRISAQYLNDHINHVLTSWRKPQIYMPVFIDALTSAFQLNEEVSEGKIVVTQVKPLENQENRKAGKSESLPQESIQEEPIDGKPILTWPYEGGLQIDFETLLQEELSQPRSQSTWERLLSDVATS